MFKPLYNALKTLLFFYIFWCFCNVIWGIFGANLFVNIGARSPWIQIFFSATHQPDTCLTDKLDVLLNLFKVSDYRHRHVHFYTPWISMSLLLTLKKFTTALGGLTYCFFYASNEFVLVSTKCWKKAICV